ncbi:hypothetical protein ACH5RR_006206 [Cinchona calisaya]|uniref:Glucan endo-1,3-beta-D-glucosidase n=1 Tax=Cinchona calisaya TaxID=153742 RepID=A0ABD3ANB6_9GENT
MASLWIFQIIISLIILIMHIPKAIMGDKINIGVVYPTFAETLLLPKRCALLGNVESGGDNVTLGVSETGWPSAGNGNVRTPDLASTYDSNLVKHVVNDHYPGTPKRPGPVDIEAFILVCLMKILILIPKEEILESLRLIWNMLFTPIGNKHFEAADRRVD